MLPANAFSLGMKGKTASFKLYGGLNPANAPMLETCLSPNAKSHLPGHPNCLFTYHCDSLLSKWSLISV